MVKLTHGLSNIVANFYLKCPYPNVFGFACWEVEAPHAAMSYKIPVKLIDFSSCN